jgi:hypothetical protein
MERKAFGVKPPKRGIELGWVTRGTRLKKPSSSRGFTCKARGAWGSWGLKTEIFFFSLFKPATTTNFIFIIIFFRASAQTVDCVRRGGGTSAGADTLASAWTRVFYPR